MSQSFQGIQGAPGIAFGTIATLNSPSSAATPTYVGADSAPQRFATAKAVTIKHLQALGAELRAEGQAEEAAIFDAQATFAADPALEAQIMQLVQEGVALDGAILTASNEMAAMLAHLDDPYLRERAADVRAVGEQLAATVRGASLEVKVGAGAIVVAADLTVAQIAQLRKQRIAGLATTSGTATGHVAILARALAMPAVVGLGDITSLADGVAAILVPDEGLLIVDPTPQQRAYYAGRLAEQQAQQQQRDQLRSLPAQTSDGHVIRLWANIGHPDEAGLAAAQGAEGIGLFRTEFLFLERASMPDEEEQVTAYSAVLQAMRGLPVVIRTLDIGGDKPLPYLPSHKEENPFLGTRGIRFTMRHPELLQMQLRALLRAASAGDLRIMVPMVSTLDDVRWAVAQLAQARANLQQQQQPHRGDVPFGIMLETPAAMLMLDQFKPLISFCSIGSNDLSQYALAADRTDGDLARRYAHTDPAVLRLIALAARAARVLELPLSVCGELAADPAMSVALVGMGITTLSMTAPALPLVKSLIRATTLAEAQAQARVACQLHDLAQEHTGKN